jgi:AAA family ATP:ADP antiporter
VSVLTLITQLLITGQLLKRVGTGVGAAILPAVYIVGFAVLAVMPTLIVVMTVQIVQRWMNFAIANPARHLFFTVVTREEKYKAKNLVDVVVYRGSDALSGWIFDSLQALGLKLGAIALFSLPVAAGWFLLSLALGRTHEKRTARSSARAGTEADREYRFDPA